MTNMKIAGVWDVTPCSLVNCTDAPEYPAASIIVHTDDEGNRIPWKVGILLPHGMTALVETHLVVRGTYEHYNAWNVIK